MVWDDTKTIDDLIQSSEWNSMVTDQKGRVVGTSINEAIADTAANLPAAGTSGRIFFETDTGRTLYDNGTSWVEVGLSESQISLANLSSNSYADLSDGSSFPIPNTDLNNSSLTVAGNSVSLGGSTTVATTDLSDQNITTPSAGDTVLYDATNSEFVNAAITAGTALGSTSADGSFTLNVQEGNITHDNLSGFVSNEHIDHSTVSISSGSGLTGGGDITASRTLDVDIGGQTSVTAASSDEVLIEDASDTGNTKKTTAQNIADLGGGGNVPAWTEDANSPLTISSSSTGTITLGDTYKVVKVILVSSSMVAAIGMRINGDTGTNYDFVDVGGGLSTGSDGWRPVFNTGQSDGNTMNISGEWSDSATVGNLAHGSATKFVQTGENGNVTSPLDSITFYNESSNSFSLTARVYGLK